MNQTQFFRQMLDFNKTTFNNTLNAMTLVQDQAETMANTMMIQANWLPDEGKKAIREWIEACKKGREAYKSMMEDAFKKVETVFNTMESA